MDAEFEQRLREEFLAEMREHLAAMSQALLRLEREPLEGPAQAELISGLRRSAHSLKGAARAVGFLPVEELAHDLESAFEALAAGRVAGTGAVVDAGLRALDSIETAGVSLSGGEQAPDTSEARARLQAAAAPQEETPAETLAAEPSPVPRESLPPEPPEQPEGPAAETPPALAVGAPPDSVRVATRKLDSLLAGAGQLLAASSQIAERSEELAALESALRAQADHLARASEQARTLARWGSRPRGAHPEREETAAFLPLADLLAGAVEDARRSADEAARARRRLAAGMRALGLAADVVRSEALSARLVPVSELFRPAERVVRDVARETGKEAWVQVSGVETELDRHIVESLRDPLMHLVRNAVDHGIEPPDTRERLGKPRAGTVTLRAAARGGQVVVTVADDGVGIAVGAVREAAVHAGVLSAEEAERLSDEEAIALIFAPRVSTAARVSTLSGRGVGLDVVRRNVEAVQGRVEVNSVPGQGTRFTLVLSLTLALGRLALVSCAGQLFGIPTSAVVRFARGKMRVLAGRGVLSVDEEQISAASLSDVLELGDAQQEPHVGIQRFVILAAAGRRMALAVDEVVGERDALLKSLGPQLPRVRNVSGAALLGSGQLVMVLNPADLVRSVLGVVGRPVPAAAEREEPAQRAVLLADDSRTTRTLERQILTAAGYRVLEAQDGAQALALLARNRCDAVVSDVVMPGVDGLELTRRLRASEEWRHLPVILVTAQESREDREAGMDAGADAYLVKRTFDQGVLLSTLRRLIG